MLQQMKIRTQGDDNELHGTVGRGVPGGSPISPTLFDMYKDSYVEWLRSRVPSIIAYGNADGRLRCLLMT